MRVAVIIPKNHISRYEETRMILECLHWSAFDNMADGPWHTTDMVFKGLMLTDHEGEKIEAYVLEADIHEGLPKDRYDSTTFRSDWTPTIVSLMRKQKAVVLQEA